ncbi:DnaJ domain-containing protein [Devosia sp. 1566]|uniref:DnaJ domain-containing protein n=1 Tax=Devosia sp. 1566 TaxID=2499144 RepID=UPI000FD8CFA3|nr:DnaJ domain-containing protein [Devosia sp. 1566]
MTYILLGSLALLATLAIFNQIKRYDPQLLRRGLRWLVGGLGVAIATLLLVARRLDLALFVGAAAFAVLRTGRLGPFSLQGPLGPAHNISKVRSYRFAMELDHDTGAVSGRILNGEFAGMDLLDLGEADTRTLLAEVAGDADSLSLLESWLDANRSGWREYFAQQDSGGTGEAAPERDPLEEAYAILGLEADATEEQIRTAHRELMKAVHPDHGGSSYLAAKINQARDLLLKHAK